MPAYNAAAFLAQSINSVLAQSYKDLELIVIDDGSTDNTAAIVKQWQNNDKRIVYHFQSNKGLGAARNSGLKLAKGQWVAFLDSDDLWAEDKLRLQLNAAIDKNADVVFTNGYYLNNDELKVYESLTGFYSGHQLYKLLLTHNHIPVLSVCIKKTLIDTIGFMDTMPLAYGNEDWDYWLRACKANVCFLGMEEKLFQYRLHDNNMSKNKSRMLGGSYYVISKNYDRSLLNNEEQVYQKSKLLSAIPYITKQMFKKPVKAGIRYAVLIFKILFVSRSVIPTSIYNLIKNGLKKTPQLSNNS